MQEFYTRPAHKKQYQCCLSQKNLQQNQYWNAYEIKKAEEKPHLLLDLRDQPERIRLAFLCGSFGLMPNKVQIVC